jgi:hypothetical protein
MKFLPQLFHLLVFFSPATLSHTPPHVTSTQQTVATDFSNLRGRNRNLHELSSSLTPSRPEIYEQIRHQTEQNCLIPHPHPQGNDPHDPRTVLNPSKKCLIFYLHNHKSGGTTICSTIWHQGYVSNLNDNCLPPPPYHHHEFLYAMEHNYNFIAQEGPYFHPNLTNTQMLYMTTIRNPYDRIISHLHHEFCERKEESAIELMKSFHCEFDIRKVTLAEIILSNCFNETLQYFTVNFYLRMFTNCVGSQCTEEHLHEAIEKLNVMSVVMITDTPEEYAKYDDLLYHLHLSSLSHPSFLILPLTSRLPILLPSLDYLLTLCAVDMPTFSISNSPFTTKQSIVVGPNKIPLHNY